MDLTPDAVQLLALLDDLRSPQVGRAREGTYTDAYRLFRNHPRALAAVTELVAAGVLEHATNGYLHRPPRQASTGYAWRERPRRESV